MTTIDGSFLERIHITVNPDEVGIIVTRDDTSDETLIIGTTLGALAMGVPRRLGLPWAGTANDGTSWAGYWDASGRVTAYPVLP